jgi:RsmE family RNA methyltransferase
VNLILFEPEEVLRPLPRSDPRAQHIVRVLGRREGETFDAGLINGPRGKATAVSIDDDALTLRFSWVESPPSVRPMIVLVGLPRPQTARDILRDATTLGATALHFVKTARSDPNYAGSSLWSTGEWRRHAIAGAEQAFDTRLPEVTWTHSLEEAVTRLPAPSSRLALDVYEGAEPLAWRPQWDNHAPVVVALGPERGWEGKDRETLKAAGFSLVHLGPRVLRTETAVVAALSVIAAADRNRSGMDILE